MHIFIIAGEPSGDALAARLMAGIKDKADEEVVFSGVGGPFMAQQGLNSIFPMSDLSIMGVLEVLPKIPLLLKRINQTVQAIKMAEPDIVITVDAPDFCNRVARKIRSFNIPMVHYVAPSVWAWRAGRAKKIARLYDHLLTLLPFEPPYFEKEGLPATCIGHSVIESGADKGDGDKFRADLNIPVDQKLLMLLPGSRFGEVKRHMDIFRQTVDMVHTRHPDIKLVIPTIEKTRSYLAQSIADWAIKPELVMGEKNKFNAMAAADVALAASGTVALELAMAKLPTVIAYKMNPVTSLIARKFVKLDYVNLINIIQNQMIVPELLLEDCVPDRLAAAVCDVLENPVKQQQQIEGYGQAMLALGYGAEAPGARAADIILKLVKERTQHVS